MYCNFPKSRHLLTWLLLILPFFGAAADNADNLLSNSINPSELSNEEPRPQSADMLSSARGKNTQNGNVEPQLPAQNSTELSNIPPEPLSSELELHEAIENTNKKHSIGDDRDSETQDTDTVASIPEKATIITRPEHSEVMSTEADIENTAAKKTDSLEITDDNVIQESKDIQTQEDNIALSKVDDETVPLTQVMSETEQDSYVIGMIVADYTRLSLLRSLEKLNIYPDRKLVLQGITDALSGRALLDGATAQLAMQRFATRNSLKQAEREEESRNLLSSLSNKSDTLERKDDRVWVRLKKGDRRVSKQTPIKLSWEGRIYGGDEFEKVNNYKVTRLDILPSWLQQGIPLTEIGSKARLFILAGSLEREVTLPLGTAPYEIIQYTVTVEK